MTDDVLRLRHLHQVLGWQFQVKGQDELVYYRLHGEWLDVLRVRSPTDAMVGRFLAASVRIGHSKPYWEFEGTLTEALNRVGFL